MTWQFLTAGSLIPASHVLTWLIQSTVLLAVGLLAGHLLRKRGPAVQSALYRTTLGAVILCPVASVSMAALGFGVLLIQLPVPSENDRNAFANEPPGRRIRPTIDGNEAKSRTDDRLSVPTSQTLDSPMLSDIAPDRANAAGVAPPALATVSSGALPRWADIIGWGSALFVAAWLVGAAALGMRLAVGHRRMARLRSAAIDAEAEVMELCRDLAHRMRLDPPSVLRSPFLCSPCLDGLRRPAILLPEDAKENLRETFIHELAHLERRDGLWNVLRHSATALFWMQPLLWFLSKRLEATAEEVCDDYVVEFGADRCRYAHHLLELAERRLPPLAPSGVGMISLRSLLARRITRILDSTRTLSTQAGRRAIAAALLAGLVGTVLVGSLGVGGGNRAVLGDEPKVEKPSATDQRSTPPTVDASAPPQKMTVRGRVVDPDGKPVAGATVTTSRSRRGGIGPYGWDADRQEIDRTVSGTAGRFTLAIVETTPVSDEEPGSPDHWSLPGIVAWAPGFGPAWPKTLAKEVTEDKPIQLVPDDVPITGRLVDLEGRPISGASIRVDSLWVPESAEEIDRWRATVERDPATADRPLSHYFPIREKLAGTEPAIASSRSTTDAEGRFRLSGLGRDRLAILEITGATIATRRAQVVTRRMNGIVGRHLDEPYVEDPTYYGASPTIVVEPARPIEGVVFDADSKAPISGAIVTAAQLAGSPMGIEGLIATRTDAQGKYRLAGLPKGDGHELGVYPSLDQPYFITDSLKVTAGPGLDPVRFDIALHRGIWITGRVTDAQTGGPAQAAIHYYPYLVNQHAPPFPNFQPNTIMPNWTGDRYRTDPDGRFRVVGLPGRGIVAAKSFLRTYRLGIGTDRLSELPSRQSMRRDGLPTYNRIDPNNFQAVSEVNPPTDVDEFACDLKLDPGPSLTIQLVDQVGKALTGVSAWGCLPLGHDSKDLNDESRAQIFGLDPSTSRTLVFLHFERRLGAVLTLKGGDATTPVREQTVTLDACATVSGRVVDAGGKPVTGGIWIALDQGDGDPSPADWLLGGPFDGDGRFQINSLPPGGIYIIQARDRMTWVASIKKEPELFPSFYLARNLKSESGKTIDLGTFNATTGKPAKELEKPTTEKVLQDTNPASKMPITGRIVDLEGRPVTGATVRITQITKPKGDNLDPWIEAVKRGEHWTTNEHLIYEPPITPEERRPKTTTDSQGRFRFEGLEAERVVNLTVQGPTIAFTPVKVVTRRIEPIPARGFPSQHGPGSQTIYGTDLTYTSSPGRPVEGIVRDARTKQPMANVEVRSDRFAGSNFVGTKDLMTTTDAQGRFRLVGLPKGQGNSLLVVPNDDQPYFMQDVAISDPPGIEPVPVEINLHRGIWIQGKVTDQETAKPVDGARLHYIPFLENPFAQATPEFGKDRDVDGFSGQDRYQTKADGSYRLVGLPGRAIVGAVVYSKKPYLKGAGSESIKGMDEHGNFPTYFNPVWAGRFFPTSMKEIHPPDGVDVVNLDLELVPGGKVRLRVLDSRGKPVSGVLAAGRTGRDLHDREPQKEAEFEVVCLAPGEDRLVLVIHDERKLGMVFHVKSGDDKNGPVSITLEPLATLTGRVTDADGNPVSGATVRTDPAPWTSGGFNLHLSTVASDREGQFVVPKVPAGCKYNLVVESGIAPKSERVAFFRDASVRPGEMSDVGDIRFQND
jgi:beta-lactamase regulating signal transducer with metallopeptidase domain/protocatechuate 3,4-dioxygenase beta subunit